MERRTDRLTDVVQINLLIPIQNKVVANTQMPARFEKAIGKPDGIFLFTGMVYSPNDPHGCERSKKKKDTGTEMP